MVDKTAARVFDILCEKIDGELLFGNNSRGLYIWYVDGNYSPKKVLIVEYHLATRCWDITVDDSNFSYIRRTFPQRGSAEFIAEHILALW